MTSSVNVTAAMVRRISRVRYRNRITQLWPANTRNKWSFQTRERTSTLLAYTARRIGLRTGLVFWLASIRPYGRQPIPIRVNATALESTNFAQYPMLKFVPARLSPISFHLSCEDAHADQRQNLHITPTGTHRLPRHRYRQGRHTARCCKKYR